MTALILKSDYTKHLLIDHRFCSYIHGGAWRSPVQDSKDLQPALSQLLTLTSSKETINHVAGFASINYGLSTGVHDEKSLDVKHPQHIQDVIKALNWLRAEYDVGAQDETHTGKSGWDWIVVGHSCGATIAFHLSMSYSKPWGTPQEGSFTGKPPIAVVGLEGLYDLPLLNQVHLDEPIYAAFITSAFGSDRKIWKEVSPAYGQFKPAFHNGGLRLVVLGHSSEDELVGWEQVGAMWRVLEGQGWSVAEDEDVHGDEETPEKRLVLIQLKGTHDEIWDKGTGVRKGIEIAIRGLFR
jgi:kynurenine formamidase